MVYQGDSALCFATLGLEDICFLKNSGWEECEALCPLLAGVTRSAVRILSLLLVF